MQSNYLHQEIFYKLQKGDHRALKDLFDNYYVPLCRAANLYLNNKDVSEEIVQDVYVYLWENREKIEITTSLKSYLYNSVRNKSINYIRDHKRFESIELNDTVNQLEDIDHSFLELHELQELLEAAIESLPDKCKKIFRMSRDEELSAKEIAEREGISPKTVENQITIAIRKVRRFMGDYYLLIPLIDLLK